jgi:carbamoyl-phosphate synthase large subunit
MAVYPGVHLSEAEVQTIVDYTQRIGLAIDARGLINVQYVIMPADDAHQDGTRAGESDVYVLEVNPRGSRTVPFLSKVTGVPMVQVAVNIMLGRTLAEQGYEGGLWPRRRLVAVKAPVFSMSKLIGVDTYLGPEMKSTGEVMGIDAEFAPALAKALLSADLALKPGGGVLLSIADRHKTQVLPLIHHLYEAGFKIFATEGTAEMIASLGLPVEQVAKRLDEGHPNVVDVINDGSVSCVINTPEGRFTGTLRDGFFIRRAATEKRIPCFTSIDTARVAVNALIAGRDNGGATAYQVRPIHEYRDGARA